jgi:hypothetical protein
MRTRAKNIEMKDSLALMGSAKPVVSPSTTKPVKAVRSMLAADVVPSPRNWVVIAGSVVKEY